MLGNTFRDTHCWHHPHHREARPQRIHRSAERGGFDRKSCVYFRWREVLSRFDRRDQHRSLSRCGIHRRRMRHRRDHHRRRDRARRRRRLAVRRRARRRHRRGCLGAGGQREGSGVQHEHQRRRFGLSSAAASRARPPVPWWRPLVPPPRCRCRCSWQAAITSPSPPQRTSTAASGSGARSTAWRPSVRSRLVVPAPSGSPISWCTSNRSEPAGHGACAPPRGSEHQS